MRVLVPLVLALLGAGCRSGTSSSTGPGGRHTPPSLNGTWDYAAIMAEASDSTFLCQLDGTVTLINGNGITGTWQENQRCQRPSTGLDIAVHATGSLIGQQTGNLFSFDDGTCNYSGQWYDKTQGEVPSFIPQSPYSVIWGGQVVCTQVASGIVSGNFRGLWYLARF